MSQFTPWQPLNDILTTPQEWIFDPKVSIDYDDLYDRAWGREYGMLIFDAKDDDVTPPNSPRFAFQPNFLTEETGNTPGTELELFRQAQDFCEVKDTYPYKEPDAEANSDQPNNKPTNPRSSKYNPKPTCNDDYRTYFLCWTYFLCS